MSVEMSNILSRPHALDFLVATRQPIMSLTLSMLAESIYNRL